MQRSCQSIECQLANGGAEQVAIRVGELLDPIVPYLEGAGYVAVGIAALPVEAPIAIGTGTGLLLKAQSAQLRIQAALGNNYDLVAGGLRGAWDSVTGAGPAAALPSHRSSRYNAAYTFMSLVVEVVKKGGS
jgi:hypothetical protein